LAYFRIRICAAVFLFILISMASPGFSADTVPPPSNEKIDFKKMGFLNPEDRTSQRYTKDIGKQIRHELASAFRFEIVPQSKLAKGLPLTNPELIDLGKKFELDGIITGMVEIEGDHLKIDLNLLEAKTGRSFAREFGLVKNYKTAGAIEEGVRTIVGKLIGRIPYEAVVAGVQNNGKTITIDAGRLNGLGDGMQLQVFRIVKVNRHPFTQEVIGVEKVNVGTLTVVHADDRVSVAKPLQLEKGQAVAQGQYVVFNPSAELLSQMGPKRNEFLARQEREWRALEEAALKGKAKEKAAPAKRISRGELALYGGTAWSRFRFDSDQLVFNRNVSTFALASVSGEFWVTPSVGVDAGYQIGFAKLENIGGSSINVRARPYWYSANLKYRLILRPGTTDLELIGRAGYAWYVYRLSETDTQFLTNTRYQGPSVGLEGRLPLSSKISARLGVDYQPLLKVDESPVTSGDNVSSWSIGFHAEGRYQLGSNLWISIRYLFNDVFASYSGTGTRSGGVTGAKTKDELNSVMLGFGVEF
jgi:DNA-binding Lrp family transcriptional regulator